MSETQPLIYGNPASEDVMPRRVRLRLIQFMPKQEPPPIVAEFKRIQPSMGITLIVNVHTLNLIEVIDEFNQVRATLLLEETEEFLRNQKFVLVDKRTGTYAR